MTIKTRFLLAVTFLTVSFGAFSQRYQLSSPNGQIKIEVQVDEAITWSVSHQGMPVISPSAISMTVNGQVLGKNPRLKSKKEKQIREDIAAVVPRKSKIVEDHYNTLILNFRNNYTVAFRAYDDGVAYRFETAFKDKIEVDGENLTLNFASPCRALFPEEESYMSHFERAYRDTVLSSIPAKSFCSLPVLLQTEKGVNVLVTESGLFDYPNMFLAGTGSNALTAQFPQAVLETRATSDRNEKITKEADYIAATDGRRQFPWRVFVITPEDEALISSDLVFKLARPVALTEASWIKPGHVAWDWFNANNIYGVDFRAGLNTDTYKYYIDFASKYGLEYIILDEGWSKTTTDLTAANADIDLAELIAYGKSKNVGVILWMLWKPLDENLESLFDQFARWGVKGIKVDFMQRADQAMVNYYERVAAAAGKRKLLVDFHGAYKPTGLHRVYPNVISFEGVKGAENDKWSKDITPEHNVTLPFTRMVAGPMDYTPGSVRNANKESFRAIFDSPMSMGTRCHQLAMYVVFESPLQMLADSPTHYYQEPESASFMSRIPVTWDTTVVLDAKVADYVLIARRKDDKWYVGAMTDWTPRDLTLDCGAFLPEGAYTIEMMEDGINADRNANDYRKHTQQITSNSKLTLKLAPGGGWAAIIKAVGR